MDLYKFIVEVVSLNIRNAQGDITGLFDKNGTTVVEYTYDSWGKLISTTGSLASTVGAKNPYRYRGYRYDTETGLYYLQSRYYNPTWGRFINADATLGNMGELLGNNMFAYCGNNPVNLSDPEGEFAFLATMAICGVVGAVVSAVTTAGMQYYTTGKVNTTDVLVAAGVGFVAGALTPVVGASTWGMVGLGAGASVAQTVITNKVNGKSTSGKDIVKSAIIGGAAGAIGGKFTNLKGGYKPQTHYGGSIRMIPKDNIIVQMEAEEILNKATLNAYQNAVTVRSFVSGFFSNGGADQIIDAATNRIKIFTQPIPVGDFYYKI